MGNYVMTVSTQRQLTGEQADMTIKVFAFSRKSAERKLQKIAASCYGEDFTVKGIARA